MASFVGKLVLFFISRWYVPSLVDSAERNISMGIRDLSLGGRVLRKGSFVLYV
jgi:hypothetical protein